MNTYNSLIAQIDAFIRKFYKNEIIKGSIILFGILLFSVLFIAILEYFGRFSSLVRAILLFSFILSNLFVLIRFIIVPFLKLNSFGERINHYQAAEVIGSFFPNISDQLLNTLQLQNLAQSDSSNELLIASIQQRSEKLSVIPFKDKIDFKANILYVKYILPVIIVFILLSIFFPTVITQGTKRVVNYNQIYKPEAPFSFNLLKKPHNIQEGDDFTVLVELKGNQIPEKVYINSSEGKFLMNPISKTLFSFDVSRVKSDFKFFFEANSFESDQFVFNVIPKAIIGNIKARLKYPTYLNYKNEELANVSDLTIPEGTTVEWEVISKNIDILSFYFKSTKFSFSDKSTVKFSKRFLHSDTLNISYRNKFSQKVSNQKLDIQVIKDEFPLISVSENTDSISKSIKYFQGSASDDYLVNSIKFFYQIKGSSKKESILVNQPNSTSTSFNFAFDFRRLNVNPGDLVEYYFIVYDNDGINGSKSSKSSVMEYKFATIDEVNDNRENSQEQAKAELNSLVKQAAEFQKNLDRFKKESSNTKSNDWSKINQLKQLQSQQLELQKALENVKNKLNDSFDEKLQLSDVDLELLEKQKQIEDLLNSLMDKEMLDLLNKIEDLLKKQDVYNLDKELDKLKDKSENINKNLDRTLESLKKMQVNEKIDAVENHLKELSKEQMDLKNDLDSKKIDSDKAIQKQEKINDKFQQLKDDLQELNKLNDKLGRPLNLGDLDKPSDDIEKSLQDSKSDLEKNKEKSAKSNQQKASEEMEKLANQLDQNQNKSNEEQQGEDIEMLRSILQNLMTLSFNQESLMERFKKIQQNDPLFVTYGKEQRKLINSSKMVEDSLLALAKRQPMIASFVDQELNDIKTNLNLSIGHIGERRKPHLLMTLQYVMTSYNNLALLLNESLQQMQAEMQAQSKKSGSCDNPNAKGKKPGSSSGATDMKETLKKQLEKLEKGQNPNGKKPGSKPGENGIPLISSQDAAKMAAEQRAIRQQLEKMRNELNKDGKGNGNKLNPLIDALERQEKDVLNKNFSSTFINRQQEIITRLLESDKALRERGFEENRQSKSVKDYRYSNLFKIDEYNQLKIKQVELLKSVDPSLTRYYKQKANQYFNRSVY